MTFTAPLEPEEIARLEKLVHGPGFTRRDIPYARFSAKGEGVVCTVYQSGKCVIQGRGLDQFLDNHLPDHKKPGDLDPAVHEFDHVVVGSDEAGKGDYFGPLVTAATAFGPEDLPLLEELRFTDSKAMRPGAIKKAAALIRESLPHEIVVINPPRYNELYEKVGNLNKILAWSHGTAIAGVLKKRDAPTIVVDQFCSEGALRAAFRPEVNAKTLVLRTKAESNPAVAAASVLASDAFTRALLRLGREVDLTLPKGAGKPVDLAARRLVQVKGREVLRRVAKLHFATTAKI